MDNKRKVALTVGAVGAAGVVAWAASKAIVKRTPREQKALFQREQPFHFTSHYTAPLQTDFATTIHLTADEQIVSQSTKALTENIAIEQRTLDDLLADELVIPLASIVEQLSHFALLVSIEDDPLSFEGSLMPSKLWEFIEVHDLHDQIIVTSPYDEQLDRFNLYAQNNIAIAATEEEVNRAYAAFSSALSHLYQPNADVFIMRWKDGLLRNHRERFIQFLSTLNVHVLLETSEDVSDIKSVSGTLSVDLPHPPL